MSNEPESATQKGEFSEKLVVAASPSPAGPLTAEELITLNEELAAMAKAGLPLDQGLALLAREMGYGRLQKVTAQLAADLQAGFTLPQAIERQQSSVPPYYAALLNAGVRSGKLGEVLGTVSLYARSVADFRNNVISAILYPAIVLVVGVGLMVFVSKVVLPTFAEMFQTMRMRLPLMTEIMLFIGEHSVTVLVLPLVGLFIGLLIARLALGRTPAGRMLWARFVYALPIIGTLIRSARLAAFSDLLGLLIDQSVPLPEAWRLAVESSSDPLLVEGGKLIDNELREGVTLSEALHRQRLVPELIVWMIGWGERQGTLGPSLHQVAQMYRRESEVRGLLMRTVLPPLLVLIVSGLMGAMYIFGVLQPVSELMRGLAF
jgi:general secretion pathway protein F